MMIRNYCQNRKVFFRVHMTKKGVPFRNRPYYLGVDLILALDRIITDTLTMKILFVLLLMYFC